jgi:hypothetical protein
MGTNRTRSSRNTRTLWILILLAGIYGGLVFFWRGVAGHPVLAGFIGVGLGLYICSRPAANAVDLLFAERYSLRELTSRWSGIGWLSLNLFVFFVGFGVIMLGTQLLAAASL